MSTTVEALQAAAQVFNLPHKLHAERLSTGLVCHCDGCIQSLAKAAIPRAELEGQAVELLPRLIDTVRTHAMQTHSKVSHSLSDEAEALLAQIEALKAKDGTTRAA